MRPLARPFESTACSSVGAQPFGRYFQPAAGAFASEYILNRPTELIGNEIADHGRAKSRGIGRSYRAAALSPLDRLLVELRGAGARIVVGSHANGGIVRDGGLDRADFDV